VFSHQIVVVVCSRFAGSAELPTKRPDRPRVLAFGSAVALSREFEASLYR
jgi:hypothetical protein